MNKKIKGKNLMLFFKTGEDVYKALAYGTSCELDINVDMLEFAGEDTGSWRRYLPRLKSWSLSASYLLAEKENADISGMLSAGSRIAVIFGTRAESDKNIEAKKVEPNEYYNRYGYAYISRMTATGTNGNYASFSIELQGDGELYTDTCYTMVPWADGEDWVDGEMWKEKKYKL